MAIILEFRCAAHGEMEGPELKCPHGCPAAFVQQEFRTPPSIRSPGTRFVDHQLNGLARDYRLPDIKNDKDGKSVMESIRKGDDYSPRFVDIPHAKPGWTQRGEKPPAAPVSNLSLGRKGENAIDNYNKNQAPKLGALGPPKPAFVNAPNPAPEAFT